MIREPLVKVPYHIPGITILVPIQLEIMPIEKGFLIPDKFPEGTGLFTFIRLIGNIVFVPKTTQVKPGYPFEPPVEMTPVVNFDLPVEIRVGYNFDDVMKSDCDLQHLKLAYWYDSQWVNISDDAHEYQILPPSTGQIAEAKLWSWVGDPPLAWVK